jgi:ABC-type antimicrobial peptide transport system permease subunit
MTQLMRALLFEVQPTDPITFVAVPVLLALVGMLAALMPARRASRVDPLIALRSE